MLRRSAGILLIKRQENKMTKLKADEAKMLELTRHLIHLFLNRQISSFLEYLSDDFVWIGDYDNLYTCGKDAFAATVTEEAELPPASITGEEYSVLTHNRRIWVTYGRCTVGSEISDVQLYTKIHFNFVWRVENDTPVLTEAMACRTRDDVSDPDGAVLQSKVLGENLRYRQTIKEGALSNTGKIAVKEWSKPETHYLMPSEIFYIKANNKRCFVHTVDKVIITGITIGRFDGMEGLESFIRIHKSYLVNSAYVAKVRRNTITLTDGTELPMSRNIYSDVKKALCDNSDITDHRFK